MPSATPASALPADSGATGAAPSQNGVHDDALARAAERWTGVTLSKGHGTGNDFVLLADSDDERPVDAATAAALCDRHRGIGADGFIRAVPSAALPEGRALLAVEPRVRWFMDYRNADGSLSEMCGNGVRVFAAFLVREGLATVAPGEVLPVGTRGGVKYVRVVDGGFSVDMGPWTLIDADTAVTRGTDALVRTDGVDVDRPAVSISMGNPHTVVALASVAELEELALVRAPTVTPLPPEGTNVEFVVPADPLVGPDGVASVTMRVHERGVGETQSCGTGACAAAAAVRFWAGAGAPDRYTVTVPGGVVGVAFVAGPDGAEHVELSGPAALVGNVTLLPAPPAS
ncbi:diaminopimelate epimerase [Tersicoccus solisilvae]|uniref:Diaminopimelate epimerase n=1 Tax=Tersicoccus solisilvae TaxID=1882339 RepID=A0ABQ1PE38_9MICC|nr:diaminopimelate epimerase [Tersicoccus solisilvae]GGC95430.1 diaminopimelate epimerase [Tersicoccus solisilvae]